MSPGGLNELKEDVLDQFDDAAKQFEAGGPTAVSATPCADPAGGAPAIAQLVAKWRGITAKLDADAAFQTKLMEYFVTSVRLSEQDAYLKEHLPQRVLDAAATLEAR